MGIVSTYPANMMKQYVERRNVTSQSAIVESRYNVNSEDHGDPHDDRIKLDRVRHVTYRRENQRAGTLRR